MACLRGGADSGVEPVSPGILHVVHEDGSEIRREHAAEVGQALSIFATGLGPVASGVNSGHAATEPPPVTVNRPEVEIAGVRCEVLWSGLARGTIGIYRIDVRGPPGIGTDWGPVVIAIEGVVSEPRPIWVKPQQD